MKEKISTLTKTPRYSLLLLRKLKLLKPCYSTCKSHEPSISTLVGGWPHDDSVNGNCSPEWFPKKSYRFIYYLKKKACTYATAASGGEA